MKYSSTLKAVSTAFALLLAASAAQAQTYYATGFEGATPDVNNDARGGNAYVFPQNGNDPLAGQNGWSTNDPMNGNAGGANFVGDNTIFTPTTFNGSTVGGIGGAFRSTTAGADLVPGRAVSNITHSFIYSPTVPVVQFNTDFQLTQPGNTGQGFNANDTFSFTLGNSSTNLISVNFAPTTNGQTDRDRVLVTAGTVVNGANGNGVLFNNVYHLNISITSATGAFTAAVSQISGATVTTFTGNVGAGLTATNFNQLGAVWTLANPTAGTGVAQTGAGDNSLFFDNISVAVPEPSTYAMMVLGFVGLGLVIRARRQQA